jgi:hypothetical protein
MKHVYYRGDERNSCSVAAVAKAAGRTFAESYAAHEARGRRPRRRTKMHMTLGAARDFGLRVEPVEVKAWSTLRDVVENQLPARGRFLVRVRGHLLAVVDGTIYDYKAGPTRRVKEVYRIAEPERVKVRPSIVQLELQLEAA